MFDNLSWIIIFWFSNGRTYTSTTFVNSFTPREIQRFIQAKLSLSSFFYGRRFQSFLGVYCSKNNIESRSQIPSFCLKGMLSISYGHFEVWNYGVGEKLAQRELFLKSVIRNWFFLWSRKPLQNHVLNTLKNVPLMSLNACFKEGCSFSICIRLILEWRVGLM